MVYTVFYRKLNNWVIPENIHTIPQAVSWNSKEEGGWLLDWNAEGMGAWGGGGDPRWEISKPRGFSPEFSGGVNGVRPQKIS